MFPAIVCAHDNDMHVHEQGHEDFAFAAAWHPDGRVLATGNQDVTTRLWDIRYLGPSFAVLRAHMCAVRALRCVLLTASHFGIINGKPFWYQMRVPGAGRPFPRAHAATV